MREMARLAAELACTYSAMSSMGVPYFSARAGSAAIQAFSWASFSSSRPMMFRFSKASSSPCHFFQPLALPAYLSAYLSWTEGSAHIASHITSWRTVRASMRMRLVAIISFSWAAVW